MHQAKQESLFTRRRQGEAGKGLQVRGRTQGVKVLTFRDSLRGGGQTLCGSSRP